MNREGKVALFWPQQLLKLHLVEKKKKSFSNQGLFFLQRTVFSDILHVGIVMFYSVILVNLAERKGVDWRCTFRLMCENLAN